SDALPCAPTVPQKLWNLCSLAIEYGNAWATHASPLRTTISAFIFSLSSFLFLYHFVDRFFDLCQNNTNWSVFLKWQAACRKANKPGRRFWNRRRRYSVCEGTAARRWMT